MVGEALAALDDVDAIVLLVECPEPAILKKGITGLDAGHKYVVEELKRVGKPAILAVNKVDLVRNKQLLLPFLELWQKSHPFVAMVPISALSGDGVRLLTDEMVKLLPEGPPLFPEEMITDRAERWLGAELIREQVFLLTKQEVPYSVAVTIDEWQERERGDVMISATIHVEKEAQKKIVVGQAGRMIREIGSRARAEITKMVACPVHLKLFVRVDEGWTGKPSQLRDLRDAERSGVLERDRPRLSHLPRPLVAIVGRPNVGKSTLFNRLCGGHHAIVEDEPGVTRDRRYGDADWVGRLFRVVDTGGLDLAAAKPASANLARGIVRQAMKAVEEADLILFVCDAREGIVAQDRDAAEALRKTGKPIIWTANKVDRKETEAEVGALYEIGADEVFGISAQHGRGMSELLDAIVERLPEPRRTSAPMRSKTRKTSATRPIRMALVGRPNAGKSSLINRFVGDERMLVDSEAGTTRDPVDTPIEINGRKYLLIDTAGIRRRSKVSVPMEKVAVAMAEKAVGRCDVCVLVVDAADGLAEQDAKVAGMCDEAGRALVICFNKLDLIDEAKQRKLHEDLNRQLQFVPWAKVVFASATTGKGLQRILDAVQHAYAAFTTRVTTGALNRWFSAVVEKHPPSLYRAHPVRLYFIQQPQASPPTFILSVNHPDGVHFSYRRYLANQLREAFQLDGTPLRIVCRERGEKRGPGRKREPSRKREPKKKRG